MKEGTSTGARGQDITEASHLPDILSVTQQRLLLSLAEMSQLTTGSWRGSQLVIQGLAKVGTSTISNYASKYCSYHLKVSMCYCMDTDTMSMLLNK